MAENPKYLVIRRRYLGDVVLLGSLLRNLKFTWLKSRIAVAVEEGYAGILGLNPDVDEVLALPDGITQWPAFASSVRRGAFTHVFDIDNTERTALIARLSGAPLRLALHHGRHPLKLPYLYTHLLHDPQDLHENRSITEYYLLALGPAGVPVATREIRLVPKETEVAEWRRFIGARRRTLLVHPGSRSPMRIWPPERFAAVCDRVQDELDVQVVLAGGPADGPLVEQIRGLMTTHVIAPGPVRSQPLFAALARACSAFLCHDSGPMHVAAAVGIPVVALYGSQNTKLFQPAGEGHRIIAPPMPCTACVSPGKCVPSDSYRNLCVQRNAPDDVFFAVRDVLNAGR